MLAGLGFSLQGNAKVTEGRQHEDRDAQFRYLSEQVSGFMAAGQPVISVDTKKKENVGDFRNGGREYQPAGQPERVNVHDFMDKELGKAIPYGIYDVSANTGWVSVGTDHDTSAFAVATLRTWWDTIGKTRYPDAGRLLICADGGGSNGYRVRAWKIELAKLAAETGLADHRLPPAAGHQQVEQNRAPPLLPDHHELAGTPPDNPPDHRRPDQQHHHGHRADRPLRPGHRRLPDRRQVHQEGRPGTADHLPRLPRRLELYDPAGRHAVTIRSYFFARPKLAV